MTWHVFNFRTRQRGKMTTASLLATRAPCLFPVNLRDAGRASPTGANATTHEDFWRPVFGRRGLRVFGVPQCWCSKSDEHGAVAIASVTGVATTSCRVSTMRVADEQEWRRGSPWLMEHARDCCGSEGLALLAKLDTEPRSGWWRVAGKCLLERQTLSKVRKHVGVLGTQRLVGPPKCSWGAGERWDWRRGPRLAGKRGVSSN